MAVFGSFFFILTLVGLREYFAMAFPRRWKDQWVGIAFGVCLSGAVFLGDRFDPVVWIDVVLLVADSQPIFSAPGNCPIASTGS